MRSNRVVQCLAAIGQLGSRLSLRLKDEPRMRESMIANDVSRGGDSARDVGTLAHISSDHEEGCMNIVLCQDVKQLQGVRIVRPVIKGQRELPAAACARGKRPSKPL